MGLQLAAQKLFDNKYFDRPEWQISDWRGQKTRHISEHIAKAGLKICDGNNDQIKNEVSPDLAMYRAQLMNTHELPEDILHGTTLRVVSVNDVGRQLLRANGQLAHYTGAAEHGEVVDDIRLQRVSYAVAHLHVAAESLALMYNIDVEEVHMLRLEDLRQNTA